MSLSRSSIYGLGATIILGIFYGHAMSQELPKILSSNEHYLPDFSYAGYGFGLKEIPGARGQVIDVADYGAIPNDDIDDTHAVLKAVAEANDVQGPVTLRFGAGRFMITEIIEITRSNFVMQGAGRGKQGTTLYFPRPLEMVDDKGKLTELREYLKKYDKRQREKNKNLDVLFSEYSWSAGFIWIGPEGDRSFAYMEKYDPEPKPSLATGLSGQMGQKNITVSDGSKFQEGQRIEVLWHNRQGKDGALVKSLYNNTEVKIGSRHWESPNRPLVHQRTLVQKVNGNTITIADTLLHNVSEVLPVDIKAWQALENVGIEDFHFEFPNAAFYGHHVEPGFNGIHLTGLADSWARNLSFHNADSAILSYNSANVTISDIRTTGDRHAHYAVHMGNVHNFLAERIQVFNDVFHSLTFNTQCTRSVYKDSEVFTSPALDQHAGANHQNLFDNITMHVAANPGKEKGAYPVFWGSGAGYWQPGHGRFNTTWNLRIIVESGVPDNQAFVVQALEEGPDARIVGLSGNRQLELDYFPRPYVENLNQRVSAVPSLYDYQLSQRKH